MPVRRVTLTLLILLPLVVAYTLWSATGRNLPPAPTPELRLSGLAGYGRDAGRGNLVGIQPYLTPWDYTSGGALKAKLDGYLQACRRLGWLTPSTLVVLPENVGTWLVVAGEKVSVYEAPTRGSPKATNRCARSRPR